MLYRLLWHFTRRVATVHQRRILVHGAERVPRDRPVLLAVNHTNAFWDAVLVAGALPVAQRVRFLARGDVFRHPLANRLLRAIGILPVYRFRDGYASLKGNDATFRASTDALAAGGTVLIFPEGQCQPVPQLQPLMKGCARLALQALDGGAEHLVVVPVGLSFAQHGRFRADVALAFGEPLPAAAWRPSDTLPPAAAVRGLTAELHARLRALVVHLDDPALRDALAEAAPADAGPDGWRWLPAGDAAAWWARRRAAAEALNADPATADAWRARRRARAAWLAPGAASLERPLSTRRLPPLVVPAAASWPPAPARGRAGLALALALAGAASAPWALPGFVLSYMALRLVKRLIRRRVRDPQFIDSLRALVGAGWFGLLWGALGLALAIGLGLAGAGWPVWAAAAAWWLPLPRAARWAWRWRERWAEAGRAAAWARFSRESASRAAALTAPPRPGNARSAS